MRKLTEPQVWREIGNHILNGGEMPMGLCDIVWQLWRTDAIDSDLEFAMIDRINAHMAAARRRRQVWLDECKCEYFAPPGHEREARAMFAYLMALEADEYEP